MLFYILKHGIIINLHNKQNIVLQQKVKQQTSARWFQVYNNRDDKVCKFMHDPWRLSGSRHRRRTRHLTPYGVSPEEGVRSTRTARPPLVVVAMMYSHNKKKKKKKQRVIIKGKFSSTWFKKHDRKG